MQQPLVPVHCCRERWSSACSVHTHGSSDCWDEQRPSQTVAEKTGQVSIGSCFALAAIPPWLPPHFGCHPVTAPPVSWLSASRASAASSAMPHASSTCMYRTGQQGGSRLVSAQHSVSGLVYRGAAHCSVIRRRQVLLCAPGPACLPAAPRFWLPWHHSPPSALPPGERPGPA